MGSDKNRLITLLVLLSVQQKIISNSILFTRLNELKEARVSDHVATCFKFLFNQEITEDEGFLIYLGEERNQLQAKIDKREQSIREARFLGPFNDKASESLECLLEKQERERQRVQALTAILVEARDGIVEKGRHVKLIEFDEEIDSD